jgi:hypothetical protein
MDDLSRGKIRIMRKAQLQRQTPGWLVVPIVFLPYCKLFDTMNHVLPGNHLHNSGGNSRQN